MALKADVLVIGAGPAGCSAAFDLCQAGFSVLLLDKASFPRVKPCGGALTIKTLRALRYSVAPIVREVCYRFQAGLRLKSPLVFPSRQPVAAMTERSEFDHFCLRRCIQEGAQFRTIAKIESVERGREAWIVKTPRRNFTGRFLVGADGANSRIRRLLGLPRQKKCGFAIETSVSVPTARAVDMQMDFGVVDRGYAWCFPKCDHVSVGLFTLHKSIRRASQRLADYCEARLGLRPTGPFHAARAPFGGRYGPGPRCPNLFLVGDAAGLVDPLLGEGIYNAVRSGQIAADAIRDIIKCGKDTYRRRLREITLDLSGSTFDSRMFYGNLDRGYRHLCLLPVRYCLMKGMALGLTLRKTKRSSLWLPCMKPPEVSGLLE